MYYWDRYANDLPFRIVDNEDEVIIMKLGKEKIVTLTNENLYDEEHPDFPNVVIVINNDPEDQTIAISRDIDSFSNSFVVANILEENFSRACNKYNLEVVVNPILDEVDFWNLVTKYKDRITLLRFSLIRPNLANISGTFKDEIRELTDSTNSLVTKVELNAPRDSALENIDQENQRVKDLADYAIQGGSQYIHMKVKGIKNMIRTEKTIK